MLPYNLLLAKVEEAISQLDFNLAPHELYDPISYTLALGGKRVRPVFTLLACDMMGGKIEEALQPAIACEIFHNFTLLHDDIMDNAPIRRGKETVFRKWNSNIAILSGDAMFATAYRLLSGIEPDLLPSILTIFSNTAIQVCEGQQYDMNFELVNTVSIPDYLNMIRLKTAVLPAACLQIGAMIAKAKMPDVEYIYQFGEKIGLAFQLMDDLLDVFGQEAKFGKQCGGDIIANKKTYLYLKAYELADIENKRKLDLLFSDIHIPDDEKIAGVKKIYETLEVANHVHRVMDELYINALQNLDRISVPEGRKSELLKFAKKLLSRES